MKPLNFFYLGAITLFISACALYTPTYFGSTYPPTTTIQTFYSAQDIKQPFEVIGHMNARTGWSEYAQQQTRHQVTERAKQVGADAVIFSEINRQSHVETTDDFSIKVQVVKFKSVTPEE